MRNFAVFMALMMSACNQPAQVAEKPVTSDVGRWAIIHSPHVQRDTMLLDTTNGDTWVLVTLGKEQDSGFGWEFVGKLQPSNSN